MFHNLKGYDNHLIMQEIGKFGVKISVIPNVLEKYMAFTINKNFVFICNIIDNCAKLLFADTDS